MRPLRRVGKYARQDAKILEGHGENGSSAEKRRNFRRTPAGSAAALLEYFQAARKLGADPRLIGIAEQWGRLSDTARSQLFRTAVASAEVARKKRFAEIAV